MACLGPAAAVSNAFPVVPFAGAGFASRQQMRIAEAKATLSSAVAVAHRPHGHGRMQSTEPNKPASHTAAKTQRRAASKTHASARLCTLPD
ncbi:hypothetical protein GQ53DRAFT_746833 [Thozetella sp. PMI_491]|nr:hypothetical protein GQ53DRAFT_746833 [Thozetella sp. PMI_491]